MGPSDNNKAGLSSFTVYSVDENGNTELLGTLDGIESVEVFTGEEPDDESKTELIFSLLKPDEVTFTAKMTFWTRIKLWIWWRKLKIQKWLTFRKFKRSFDKAAKEQKKLEKVLKGD